MARKTTTHSFSVNDRADARKYGLNLTYTKTGVRNPDFRVVVTASALDKYDEVSLEEHIANLREMAKGLDNPRVSFEEKWERYSPDPSYYVNLVGSRNPSEGEMRLIAKNEETLEVERKQMEARQAERDAATLARLRRDSPHLFENDQTV